MKSFQSVVAAKDLLGSFMRRTQRSGLHEIFFVGSPSAGGENRLNSGCRFQPFPLRSPNRSGFTLVELLAVIMIIAVLGGIVLGIAGYAARRSEDSRARADLQLLRNALEEYRLERGAYPAMDMITLNTWEAELGDFTNQFVDLTFMDPWGEPYQFRNQGRFSFDLYSMGPTGESEEYDWIR